MRIAVRTLTLNVYKVRQNTKYFEGHLVDGCLYLQVTRSIAY